MPRNDTRKSILDTARLLFAEKGPRNTTLDDIARKMHRTKTFLYHYFESKDELLRSLIDVEGEEYEREVRMAVDGEHTGETKLRSYVTTRFGIFNRIGAFYWTSRERYLEQYALIESAREKFDLFEIQLVASILSEGVIRGEFDIPDVVLVARAFIIALKGFEVESTTQGDASHEKTFDALLTIFFHGIEVRAK